MWNQPSASMAAVVAWGWFQYPFITFGPRTHTSPRASGSVTTPPSAPANRTSVKSGALPAEPTFANENSGVRNVTRGAVSVNP